MKNNNRCSRLQFFAVVFLLSIATSTNAALVSRLGGQAYYDTDINVTWLADANLAASNTFGVSGTYGAWGPGSMTWSTGQEWLAAMNAANYLGFNDWRMPTTLQPDPSCSIQYPNPMAPGGTESGGPGCTGSEMGHLYYNELGGVVGVSLVVTHNDNYNLFQNIMPYSEYWSGTVFSPGSIDYWHFSMATGVQGRDGAYQNDFVWAVRTGDVAAIPIPATFWLFGSGLTGLMGFMRLKTRYRR